jgi:probable HAF family extracellular repeat protein
MFPIVLLMAPAVAPAVTIYTISGLVPDAGFNLTTAYSINNNNDVSGIQASFSFDTTTDKATIGTLNNYLLSSSGLTFISNFGLFAGGSSDVTGSIPLALNDNGAVVGISSTSTQKNPQAFLFQGGTLTNIGTTLTSTFGATTSFGTGINNSGTVVGTYALANGGSVSTNNNTFGFVYKGGTPTQLPTLAGLDTAAIGINNAGTIVGFSNTAVATPHAFSYDGTTMKDLGTLPGQTSSAAFAINSAGDIVGYSTSGTAAGGGTVDSADAVAGALGVKFDAAFAGAAAFAGDAFFYNHTTQSMSSLGTLGGMISAALGINDSDQIVGISTDASGDFNAFLDNDGSVMINLNTLLPAGSGWTLLSANGINNAGDIVGVGELDGTFQAYLLSPNGDTITPTGVVTMGNGTGTGTGTTGTGTTGTGTGTTGTGTGSNPTAIPLPPAAYTAAPLLALVMLIAKGKGAVRRR